MRRLLVILGALLLSAEASATDYTICSTGATYTTPAAFVAAVAGGAGHNGLHCNESFGAVAISSTKTYINLKADTGGGASNAVAADHTVTASHPIYDGGGTTGTALAMQTGWYIVGLEIRNYTDAARSPYDATASFAYASSSYIHDIGNLTSEWCWKNTADIAGTVATNNIYEDCSGYGLWVATGSTSASSATRLSIINPGNVGLLYNTGSGSDTINNILVTAHDAAATWGINAGLATVQHATVIAGASAYGIRAAGVNYSITDGGAIGVCYTSRAENVVANATAPWKTIASGCVTNGSADGGSTTTAPTYVDTTDYVPCTGSSADGRSGSSAITIDIWNASRVHPEDAGASEAASCAPPMSSRGPLVDGGVRRLLVDGGVRAKLQD